MNKVLQDNLDKLLVKFETSPTDQSNSSAYENDCRMNAHFIYDLTQR